MIMLGFFGHTNLPPLNSFGWAPKNWGNLGRENTEF
jgi:hypothetical protein